MHTITFPLETTEYDRITLDKAFNCVWHIRNVLASRVIHCLNRVRARRDYRDALAELKTLPKNAPDSVKEPISKRLSDIRMQEGLSEYALHSYVSQIQHRYKRYISSHQAQKIATNVWKAADKVLFSDGKRINYKRRTDIDTIPGKSKNGAKYNNGYLEYAGLCMRIKMNEKDPYVQESMDAKISYCTISRKMFSDGWHYYVIITLANDAPKKIVAQKSERIGIDPGVSTEAIVGEHTAMMKELAPKCKEYNKRIVRCQRGIDRKKRISDPQNFNSDGTIKKGHRDWHLSNGCRREMRKLTVLFHKKAAYTKQCHNEIANEVIVTASKIFVEDMNFKALARRAKHTSRSEKASQVKTASGKTKTIHKFKKKKRFGKSINDRAPAMFISLLKTKASLYGIPFQEINTAAFKASQYNHDTDTYVKIPLSQRQKSIAGHMVLRDLYSAFLIRNSLRDGMTPNRKLCIKTFKNFLTMQQQLISSYGNTPRPACFGF